MDLGVKRALRGALRSIGVQRWELPVRDRLARDYLRGEGLEIGAQASPLRVPDGARVRYVDTATREENLRKFPHLDPGAVVSPDYVTDGFTLATIENGTQDFVIANHVLEHSPDPIAALHHWLRVLRPGGTLYAAVPLAERCFDRGRPITPLGHLIEDFEIARRDGAEALAARNRGHYEEWLRISLPEVQRLDGDRSPLPSLDELMATRAEIHFHTFTRSSYASLLRYVGTTATPAATLRRAVVTGNEVIAIVQSA